MDGYRGQGTHSFGGRCKSICRVGDWSPKEYVGVFGENPEFLNFNLYIQIKLFKFIAVRLPIITIWLGVCMINLMLLAPWMEVKRFCELLFIYRWIFWWYVTPWVFLLLSCSDKANIFRHFKLFKHILPWKAIHSHRLIQWIQYAWLRVVRFRVGVLVNGKLESDRFGPVKEAQDFWSFQFSWIIERQASITQASV